MPRLQRLIFAPEQFQPQSVILNPEQSRYLFKVLRLQIGNRFIAMDGKGKWWVAELRTQTEAQLVEFLEINHELSHQLILIAAPPKGSGFETVIHSATELGVHAIYPLMSQRTVSQPSLKKIQRWQKIATEATEQSLRQVVPTVHQPLDFETMRLKSHPWNQPHTLNFFCSTQSNRPQLYTSLLTQFEQSEVKTISILTGPEGGWSPEEEQKLTAQGMIGISLGKRILRAITAPITALSITAAFCEAEA